LSAVRRISSEEWEAELKFYGCKRIEGKGKLNTADLWLMPWKSYPFTVPSDDDGYMSQDDLDHLVRLIATSAPQGWRFDQ
jgi:hypothetical protein